MKKLILALSITLIVAQAHAADFRYKVPLPIPAPEKVDDVSIPHIAPYQVAALHLSQVNPDPFKTQPQAQQQTTTAAPGQPIVIQSTPAVANDIRDWFQTGIMGIIAAIFAKLGFAKPAPAPGPVPSTANPPPTMTDLSDAFERALLRVVQTGVPGTAIQTGLGMIPGVGPIASQLEPMIRKITIDALNQKLGLDPTTQPGAAGIGGGNFLDTVGNIVENRIKAALAQRASP